MSEIPTYPNEEEDRYPPLTHVAILFRDQVWSLPAPFRHHHIIRVIVDLDPSVTHVDGEQGFLDAKGRFLRRAPALTVALHNGQVKNGKIIGGVLTSEDLW